MPEKKACQREHLSGKKICEREHMFGKICEREYLSEKKICQNKQLRKKKMTDRREKERNKNTYVGKWRDTEKNGIVRKKMAERIRLWEFRGNRQFL